MARCPPTGRPRTPSSPSAGYPPPDRPPPLAAGVTRTVEVGRGQRPVGPPRPGRRAEVTQVGGDVAAPVAGVLDVQYELARPDVRRGEDAAGLVVPALLGEQEGPCGVPRGRHG